MIRRTGAALVHIGGGGPQLEHHPVPGEQVHLEQVDGGEAPRLLPTEGQGGVEGDQGVLRVHPRLEELLQQAQRPGCSPGWPGGPEPMPSHSRTYRVPSARLK